MAETKNLNGNVYEKTPGGWRLQTQSGTEVQRGLVGEIIPTAGAVIGGAYGGIPGSALGGGIGETIQQGIELATGERTKFEPGQVGASSVISGLVPATFKAGGKTLQAIGKTAPAQAVKAKTIEMLGWASGYADDVLKKMLEGTPGVIEGIKTGERALADVVIRSAKKISDLASKTLIESQKTVSNLDKLHSLGGAGREGSRNFVLKQGRKFVQNVANSLRTAHNIGVDKLGKLNFTRGVAPSRIVSRGDQSAIQEGFDLLNKIKKNTSIKNIDATLERMIALQSKTPLGSPSGTQTKAIIAEMIGELKSLVKTTYPKYHEFLKTNLDKRVLINEAKELFGSTSRPSPKEISQISSRLLQLYNTGRLELRKGFEKVGGEIGEDIVGTTAGTIAKIDDAFSFRAKQLGSRQLIEKVVEFIPRNLIDRYVATGKLTPDIIGNPAVQNTLKAILTEAASLTASKTKN